MDVTSLMALHDETTGFKKFLDHENLQNPLFIPIYSKSNSMITFDITPIVRKTYNWLYDRIIAELAKIVDETFIFIPVGVEMYKEYLTNEFGSESIYVTASYGNTSETDMEYKRDITDWLYIVFQRIGDYLKNEFYDMRKDLFNSVKYTSNSLHTLKVF